MTKIAVILAGGKSSRFGQDKALARIGGRPMAALLAGSLQKAGFRIVLSTGYLPHRQLGFPIIWDKNPFQGPLFALRDIFKNIKKTKKLKKSGEFKILLAACDTPFLTPGLTQWLWRQSDGQDITIFSRGRKGPSPLPGIYSAKILPVIERNIRRGEKSLKSLLEADLEWNMIDRQEWSSIEPDEKILLNINTKKDLYLVSVL